MRKKRRERDRERGFHRTILIEKTQCQSLFEGLLNKSEGPLVNEKLKKEWLLRSFVYGCHLVRRSRVHQAKMILK